MAAAIAVAAGTERIEYFFIIISFFSEPQLIKAVDVG
jgi:hypothetical protein